MKIHIYYLSENSVSAGGEHVGEINYKTAVCRHKFQLWEAAPK